MAEKPWQDVAVCRDLEEWSWGMEITFTTEGWRSHSQLLFFPLSSILFLYFFIYLFFILCSSDIFLFPFNFSLHHLSFSFFFVFCLNLFYFWSTDPLSFDLLLFHSLLLFTSCTLLSFSLSISLSWISHDNSSLPLPPLFNLFTSWSSSSVQHIVKKFGSPTVSRADPCRFRVELLSRDWRLAEEKMQHWARRSSAPTFHLLN